MWRAHTHTYTHTHTHTQEFSAQSLQVCPTLCDAMGYSPPGFSVHEILKARIVEWVAMSSSRDLPNPGIELESPDLPVLQADSLPLNHWGSPHWNTTRP